MAARFSSLPIRQLCGKAHTLDLGAGRAAAISTAFHARMAALEDPKHKPAADAALAKLTQSERDELDDWKPVEPLEYGFARLKYGAGGVPFIAESPFALKRDGSPCDKGDPDAMVEGTPDMVWNLGGVVVIGDIKKTRFASRPDSLQLHGYGFAVAKMLGAKGYALAIWIAEEARWWLGPTVMLDTDEADLIWLDIVHASTHEATEFSTGSHCFDCWGRLRCPAHMVATDDGLVVPGTDSPTPTPDVLVDMLVRAKRFEDLAESIKSYCKAHVRQNGPIHDGKGKVWKGIATAGRESTSVKKVREVFGKDAEVCITKGEGSESFRWVKE